MYDGRVTKRFVGSWVKAERSDAGTQVTAPAVGCILSKMNMLSLLER